MALLVPSGVRVVLDLSDFFSDRRKKCYYFVDFVRNRNINDVCESIRSRFSINNSVSLEINGCYVPEKEDVYVLCSEDMIKVLFANPQMTNKCENRESDEFLVNVVETSPQKKRKRKFKDITVVDNRNDKDLFKKELKSKPGLSKGEEIKWGKEGNAEISLTFESNEAAVEKKSLETEECSFSTEHNSETSGRELNGTKKKRKRCKEKLEHLQEDELNSTAHTVSPVLQIQSSENDFQAKTEINLKQAVEKYNNFNTLEEEEDESVQNDESFVKKKRRRRRKKQSKDMHLTCDIEGNSNNISEECTVPVIINNFSQHGPKHIKFVDENDDNVLDSHHANLQCEANGSILNQVGKTSALSGSHGLNNCKVTPPDTYASGVVSTSNVLFDNPAIISGGVSSIPVIFECKTAKKSSTNQSSGDEEEMKFLKYPLLNNSPKENDIIAFKKWKMDENYSPSISCYITAKVLSFSESDDSLTLKILNGQNEFKEPLGKFSLEKAQDENGQPKAFVMDDIEVKRGDLLEVRLMYP